MRFQHDETTGCYSADTTRGAYTIEPEGHRSWGVYREGSRFAAASSLAAAKTIVADSVAKASA